MKLVNWFLLAALATPLSFGEATNISNAYSDWGLSLQQTPRKRLGILGPDKRRMDTL
ncbi:MAG: hypothetical protein IPK77_11375 [Cellvibrio sp.]|nr:hypothetical protein [Cellvibrio sp.]